MRLRMALVKSWAQVREGNHEAAHLSLEEAVMAGICDLGTYYVSDWEAEYRDLQQQRDGR